MNGGGYPPDSSRRFWPHRLPPSSALSAISAWCSNSQPINRSPTASRNRTDSSPRRFAVVTHALRLRYGLTVGLWPTDARGLVGLGWFCAKPVQVPRCPATHGTPFIIGTGPPETTVGAPFVTVVVRRLGACGGRHNNAATPRPATSKRQFKRRYSLILFP